MNLRIPVPRPTSDEAASAPARGGADEEELRRIERRAERFVADQAAGAVDAMRRTEEQDRLALMREFEMQQARAISARAQTLKAEGNTRLALYFAAGTVVALVLGSVFSGGRNARVPYERFPDRYWR